MSGYGKLMKSDPRKIAVEPTAQGPFRACRSWHALSPGEYWRGCYWAFMRLFCCTQDLFTALWQGPI